MTRDHTRPHAALAACPRRLFEVKKPAPVCHIRRRRAPWLGAAPERSLRPPPRSARLMRALRGAR